MEEITKNGNYGYIYRNYVFETLQEAEDVKYIVEKFENYTQKTRLTEKIHETLNLLKIFGITDREYIYKTIKDNVENLWNVF